MVKRLIIILTILACFLFSSCAVSSNLRFGDITEIEVSVYKESNNNTAASNYSIKDQDVIKQVLKCFRDVKKVEGKIDIAAPSCKLKLFNGSKDIEEIKLHIYSDSIKGIIDTGECWYTLSEKATEDLKSIFIQSNDKESPVDTDGDKTISNEKATLPENIPSDFEFIFEYGFEQAQYHDKIDTFDNKISKDLIIDGYIEDAIELTEDERRFVYNILRNVNIMAYPSNYEPRYSDNPDLDTEREVTPSMEYELKIRVDGEIFEFYWHDSNYSEAADAVKLRDALNKIQEFIQNTPEYKAFPDSNGGYD